MKKQIIIALFLSILLSLTFVSATTKTNVIFNGNFENGTTLYSDWYHITDSTLYGDDAYKIKRNCTETIVCAKYNYTYERVCIHYARYNSSKCLSWKKIKIQGDCIKNKTKTVCDILPIGCLDSSGIYTNQLNLRNFKMSYDNSTWLSIPYGRNQIWIEDSNLIFKVEIPNVCHPTYNINSAIYIISK
jgi:hypothetical protein